MSIIKREILRCVCVDPPGKPEISGYSSDQVLKTGDTARLVCVSRGGNPLAQVYWYRNGAELDFSYVSGGGRAENELIFTIQPSDNNAVYRCAASNQMTTQPLTTDIRLTVQCKRFKLDVAALLHCPSLKPHAELSCIFIGLRIMYMTSLLQKSKYNMLNC